MDPSRRAKILRRTIVGSSLAVAVAVLVTLSSRPGGAPLVLGVGALLALLAVYECVRMGVLDKSTGAGSAAVAALGVTGFLYNPVNAEATVAQGGAALFAGACAVFARFGSGERLDRPSFALPSLLVLVLALSMPGLYAVRTTWGAAGLIVLLVLSKAGDIAGYYVGNALGRTHPFPRISPGKTTAGCVGSLVAGTLGGAAFQLGGILPEARWGLASGLLAGLIINVAAQAGDLYESWVKRTVGVKDSGTWFGPSGGVLDLIDSFLFAVPLTWLSWPLLFVAGPGATS